MAICSKCMTGFDSTLERCPKCDAKYRSGKTNGYRHSTTYYALFFFLGIGLFTTASILYWIISSISVSELVSTLITAFSSISIGAVISSLIAISFSMLPFILHFCLVYWAYKDANNRGKPGCLVAILVAITPIVGLLIWSIVRK